MKRTFAGVSVASMAVSLVATAASAQVATPTSGGIDEIVVTAQKREENVQDVPIAISAFGAEALQERAVASVASLSNLAPNITLDAGTPFSGSTSVLSAYIRGIGVNDFAFNVDPAVGIYVDGVYLARSVGANQELADVERIEVLKGPQGTLFGRNTIGGAISIITRNPGDEFRFGGDVTAGSYELRQVRASVDVPIAPGLNSSASFMMKKRDGYLQRIAFPGSDRFDFDQFTDFRAAGYDGAGLGREGGDDSFSSRAKLRWDEGGALRMTFSGDYTNVDQSQSANTILATFPGVFAGTYNCALVAQIDGCGGGPPPFALFAGRGGQSTVVDLPSVWGVNIDVSPANDRLPYDDRFITGDIDTSYATGNNFSRMKSYGGSAAIEYDASDGLTIKSITAYRELHWRSGMDLDGSPLNFGNTSFEMNQKQFSQELQLVGNALDSTLNYVVGGYYFEESGNLHDFVTFAEGLLQVDGQNLLATQNFAAFGQIDWRPMDWIGITVGGRYTEEDKTFEGFQQDNNGLTYKILNYLGVPGCETLSPISEQCRIAAGFPNPGDPLRYYVAGEQNKSFSNFSPRVGLQVHPNDDLMIYGSWSQGYRTGGWTTRLSNPLPFAPDFDEEEATTWEIGVKSTLIDRRLQVNAAAFTTKYEGIQLNFLQGVSTIVENAGNARIRGFEIEMVAAPIDGLTINASIGHLDATYTEVDPRAQVAASTGFFGQAGVFAGATLPKTPDWKFNVSPRYEVVLGNGGAIVLLADYTHSASLRNDTEGTFLLIRPATDLVNASITYRSPDEKYELILGGTNLTDERYLVTGLAQLAGGQVQGTYSRPAEWYVRLGFNF